MNFKIDRLGRLVLVLFLVLTQIPVPVHADLTELQKNQENNQPAVAPQETTSQQNAESLPGDGFEKFMEGQTLTSGVSSADAEDFTRYVVTGVKSEGDTEHHFGSLDEAKDFITGKLNTANADSKNVTFAKIGGPAFEVLGDAVLFSYEAKDGGVSVYLKEDVKNVKGDSIAKIDWKSSSAAEATETYDDQGHLIREAFSDGSHTDYQYSSDDLNSITVFDPQGSSVKVIFEIKGLSFDNGRAIASAVRDLVKQGKTDDGQVLYLRNLQLLPGSCGPGNPATCTSGIDFELSNDDAIYNYRVSISQILNPETNEKSKATFTPQLIKETLKEEFRARREVRREVMADLMTITGLTREELRGFIDSLEVHAEDLNRITVSLKFKKGKMNEARLIDVLGEGDLPDTVEYHFDREVLGQTNSIPPSTIYGDRRLTSAHWVWNEAKGQRLTADVNYNAGQISQIGWTREYDTTVKVCPGSGDGGDVACVDQPAVMGQLLYHDDYLYKNDKITITRSSFFITAPSDFGNAAHADYLAALPQEVLTLQVLQDGKNHITKLLEYDRDGKQTESDFTYTFEFHGGFVPLCVPGRVCPKPTPPSFSVDSITIDRSDSDGEHLSTTQIRGENGAHAVLADGEEEDLTFNSYRNLLEQLRSLEEKAARVRGLIFNDLLKTFGFNEAALKELIKNKLVIIKMDLKNLTASVHIDPSVKLSGDPAALNLTDPLGKNRLPEEINYKLGSFSIEMGRDCTLSKEGVANCPPPAVPTYYLESGEFHIGTDYYAELNYLEDTRARVGDNRLHSVKIFDGNPHLVCIKAPCPTGKLIKEIYYHWSQPCNGEACIAGFIQDSADIHYYNQEDREYLRRHLTLNSGGFSQLKLPFGSLVPPGGIISADDYRIDENGKETLYAHNIFKYLGAIVEYMCIQGIPCNPPSVYYSLYRIDRTDASDNPLSSIVMNGSGATITLADGREEDVTFKSNEELLREAFRFERGRNLTVEKRFENAFSFLAELAAKDTITLTDAKKMREIQARLKRAVERLPKDKQEEWIEKFNEYLNQSDAIIGTKSLKVVMEDGREILVRNHTDLFAKIIQRFKMMDQNGVIDLTRLAGIDPQDMKDLETLAQYVSARRIGQGFDLPLFDLFSPLGNLELIDRLVRKYAADNVTKTEGPVEIIVDDFLRYIDGTKPAFDAAMKLAKSIFAQYPVHIPSSPLTPDSIAAALKEIETLNSRLSKEVADQLAQFRGEEVFKNQLFNEVSGALMYAPGTEISYSQIWNQLANVFSTADVIFNIDGKEIRVSRAELDSFTNYLPWDSDNLKRYPGVKASIDPAFFNTVMAQEYYARLSSVNLRNPEIPGMTGTGNVAFSYTARRFQLLEQFMKTWPEIIKDGTVDFDRLRFRLLISYELELALGRAEEYLKGRIAEMDAFGKKEALSSEDYEAMKEILRGTQKELTDRFTPLLKDVIYDTTNEVTSRIQVRFQTLVNSFGNVLSNAKVTVQGPDGPVVFDPRAINTNVLGRILNASAIPVNGSFPREAYLRISGITPEMLAGLLSPEGLNQLKYFSFYNYSSSWQSPNFAAEEVLFKLIPAIVKNSGTADTDKLTQKMTEGMNLLVPLGQSLEATIKNAAAQLIQDTINQMNAVNLRTPEDVAKLKAIFVKLNPQLRLLADFNQDGIFNIVDMQYLSGSEFSALESWMTSYWNSPSVAQVNNLFHAKLSAIDFLEIGGVQIPVRQIVNIANFPNSKDFDAELFPGLKAEDFEYAETSDQTGYQYFRFTESAVYPSPYLTDLGRIEAAIHAVSRYLKSEDPASKLFFTDNAGKQEVDPNEFRKLIKGVYAMQQAVLEETRRQVKEAAAELEKMRKGHYTIEEVEALHQKVLDLRENLIKMLEEKASKHERQDVLAIENEVSVIFQKGIFDLFVSMVGDAKLVIEINGRTVTVPAKAITDALIAYLKTKKGSDSIAAHDFATLYGISVDDVRRVHKMENYLSEQMVVLPKNSEWVQIISQMSELGYMELASMLVKRYADEVIVDGKVDVDLLVRLVSDKDRAVKQVKKSADKIYSAKFKALKETAGTEMSLDALNKIVALMEDAKGELVSLMNDFLSGNSDDALLADLEDYVNSLYGKLKLTRDGIFETTPFIYEVEGKKISILLNKETISRFAQAAADWLAANPGYKEPYPIDPIYPIALYDVQILSVKAMAATDTIDLMPKIKPIDGGGIWFPYPDPTNYNPGDHPTDFGLAVLFARLAVKYGELAVDENGFSMELFIQELQTTDQSRAERRLQVILDKELPALKDFIDSLREDGAFPVEKIGEINEKFSAVKERIRALGNDANARAQEVWSQFMQAYENALFEGTLSATIGGQKVTFEPQILNSLLMKLHNEGALDPELMKKFDEMIQNGETSWQYNDFKNLSYYLVWMGYDMLAPISVGLAKDEDLDAREKESHLTLGELERMPGISPKDLNGLDVMEKDRRLKLTPADPLTLLGLLDMRALAPGSGAGVGGLMTASGAMMADSRRSPAVASLGAMMIMLPEGNSQLPWKSFRFNAFELIPAILKEMGSDVLSNGKVVTELFDLALQGKLKGFLAERAKMLAEADQEIAAVQGNLDSLKILTEEQIQAMEDAIKSQRGDYAALVSQLQAVLGKNGIDPGTRAAIENFLKPQSEGGEFLSDQELESQMTDFIDAVRFNNKNRQTLANMDANYLQQLEDYRAKIAAANSEEGLNIVHPARMVPPPFAFFPENDPRGFLTKAIQEGKVLLEEANQQIRILSTQKKVTVKSAPAANYFSNPNLAIPVSVSSSSSRSDEEEELAKRKRMKRLHDRLVR